MRGIGQTLELGRIPKINSRIYIRILLRDSIKLNCRDRLRKRRVVREEELILHLKRNTFLLENLELVLLIEM
jgi:hypothetical protein